jgi:CheY-like chemotaxis protein
VEEAASGVDALVRLRSAEAPFGLVLLDMQMPGMDGEQTAAAIRADGRLATLPIVLLSSSHPAEAPANVFDAALTKPIRERQLLRVLQDVLGIVRGEDSRTKPANAAEPVSPQGPRVLVAEDNEINRRVALAMLERIGCRVETVVNGREALEAQASRRYDLVLMDVQMPEMDGLTATAAIRARERASGHRPPIIAMTAHGRGPRPVHRRRHGRLHLQTGEIRRAAGEGRAVGRQGDLATGDGGSTRDSRPIV